MYLYPALSNVIETVWQYTGFALNMPIENAISFPIYMYWNTVSCSVG